MFCRKCGKPNPDDSRFCEGCGKSFVDTGDHASGNTGRFTSDQDPFLGQTIAGTFRLDSVLGRGGMGVVYLATNLRINAQMALKVLALNLAQEARDMAGKASAKVRSRIQERDLKRSITGPGDRLRLRGHPGRHQQTAD